MSGHNHALRRADLFDPSQDPAGLIAEADGVFAGLAAALGRTIRRAAERWTAHQKFRRDLAYAMSLDDRMLADMGLTRHDLEATHRARRRIRAADQA